MPFLFAKLQANELVENHTAGTYSDSQQALSFSYNRIFAIHNHTLQNNRRIPYRRS